MSDKKINLEKIFQQQNPQDGTLPQWAILFAKEVCRQTLKLAAENARTTWKNCNHSSGQYCDCLPEIDEESITNTMSQVE